MIESPTVTLGHGERFGKMKALRSAGPKSERWWVGCACGSLFKVKKRHLINGKVTACLKCTPPNAN